MVRRPDAAAAACGPEAQQGIAVQVKVVAAGKPDD
jgi:hypothetical protein